MTNLIEDFAGWLRDADKSKQTLRAYVGALDRFGKWFEQTNRTPLTAAALTPTEVTQPPRAIQAATHTRSSPRSC